jgi:hypothetical protein
MTASIVWQLIDCYFIATDKLRQQSGLLQVRASVVIDLHELDRRRMGASAGSTCPGGIS